MPPRFSSVTGARFAKSTQSANGTSGAPSPPAAMSALRKSQTVVIPVRMATRDASPSCKVAWREGTCATVCPWTAITSGGRSSLPTRAAAASA